jgi:hypothetical protein
MSGKLAGIDVSARHVADMMPSFPTCCVIVLLSCQPLMDGICDDVLDVVEGITGETVIKLTQEEKGIIESMVQTRKCILERESVGCDRLEN